jgi:hypothetical protein
MTDAPCGKCSLPVRLPLIRTFRLPCKQCSRYLTRLALRILQEKLKGKP